MFQIFITPKRKGEKIFLFTVLVTLTVLQVIFFSKFSDEVGLFLFISFMVSTLIPRLFKNYFQEVFYLTVLAGLFASGFLTTSAGIELFFIVFASFLELTLSGIVLIRTILFSKTEEKFLYI